MTRRLKLAPPTVPTAQTGATKPPETAEAAERGGIVEGQGMGAAPFRQQSVVFMNQWYHRTEDPSTICSQSTQKKSAEPPDSHRIAGLNVSLTTTQEGLIDAAGALFFSRLAVGEKMRALAVLAQADFDVSSVVEALSLSN